MVQKISNNSSVDEIEDSIKKTLQREISGEVKFDEIFNLKSKPKF